MVFIVVAVQNCLDDIKNTLVEKGYQVVDIERYKYPIDALVYLGDSSGFSHIPSYNMPEMVTGKRANYGIFMIDATGRSMDEIEYMLKSRYYSPLF